MGHYSTLLPPAIALAVLISIKLSLYRGKKKERRVMEYEQMLEEKSVFALPFDATIIIKGFTRFREENRPIVELVQDFQSAMNGSGHNCFVLTGIDPGAVRKGKTYTKEAREEDEMCLEKCSMLITEDVMIG